MKLKTYTGNEVRELRNKVGLNQAEFWQHFQTTQSGGSRYESGRAMPGPVQLLMNIAFGSEAKSATTVDALRMLSKSPRKTKSTKIPLGFGMLP